MDNIVLKVELIDIFLNGDNQKLSAYLKNNSEYLKNLALQKNGDVLYIILYDVINIAIQKQVKLSDIKDYLKSIYTEIGFNTNKVDEYVTLKYKINKLKNQKESEVKELITSYRNILNLGINDILVRRELAELAFLLTADFSRTDFNIKEVKLYTDRLKAVNNRIGASVD